MLLLGLANAQCETVDFRDWIPEQWQASYVTTTWTPDPTAGAFVTAVAPGTPAVGTFHNNVTMPDCYNVTIMVTPTVGDDDWVGLVFGFGEGYAANASIPNPEIDYLVLLWKDIEQGSWPFPPQFSPLDACNPFLNTPGNSTQGLELYRFQGYPTLREQWTGVNWNSTFNEECFEPGNVTWLTNFTHPLSTEGWELNMPINFTVAIQPTRIDVWVADMFVFNVSDLDPRSTRGSFGVYHLSQTMQASDGEICTQACPPPPTPAPPTPLPTPAPTVPRVTLRPTPPGDVGSVVGATAGILVAAVAVFFIFACLPPDREREEERKRRREKKY